MTEKELKDFICDLILNDGSEIESEQKLFSAGLMDSMNFLELIQFVEKKCKIRVTPSQMNLDNWDSVANIMKFVIHEHLAFLIID